jgi:hypothetical protein
MSDQKQIQNKPWDRVTKKKAVRRPRPQSRVQKDNTDRPKVQTDRGLCKFFILDKCSRGEECQWVHTKNQCKVDDCEVYTERDNCYKCHKKVRQAKKAAYEKKLREEGYRCSNQTCSGYTLYGDYCNECFEESSQYILGPCRNRQCSRRVLGGRGYCGYCN